MDFTLYNSLTRSKEIFVPQESASSAPDPISLPYKVKMYVCGPTVYDFAHLGNARAMVVFDLLFRVLKHQYAQVVYVRNITDIDDKICASSIEQNCDFSVIAKKFEDAFMHDMESLRVLPPTKRPRATAHIAEMINLIQTLVDKGFAYERDGHVLFAVKHFASYGKLAHKPLAHLFAGARINVAAYKEDAGDFVLWKPSDATLPGWESPWGRGRPGWHIECSAMSLKYLGETFDIHGGGIDLIFPHHENERAQSCCALGVQENARFWVHNGHLLVNGQKMSKSLGNFKTVRDLVAEYPSEAIRLALLTTHYRQPFDWTESSVQMAQQILNRWYRVLARHEEKDAAPVEKSMFWGPHGERIQEITRPFFAALYDDLHTPNAIQALGALIQELDKTDNPIYYMAALYCGQMLGICYETSTTWFQHGITMSDAEIAQKVDERQRARAQKDFARSDAIRDELLTKGIVLEDASGKTTWRRK